MLIITAFYKLLLITVKKQQHTTDAIHGTVSIKLHAARWEDLILHPVASSLLLLYFFVSVVVLA